MTANLAQLIYNFDMKVTGIIHVGAHYGEEVDEYLENGIENIVLFEASKPTFNILKEKINEHDADIRCYNLALGSEYCEKKTMYTETANKGQSSSFLKPAKHLEQFPDIIFNGEEEITIQTLDSIWESVTKKEKWNMLVADVQGFELEVLKGATETLKHINYVYLEVNNDEVYEDCAKVWEIDKYLKGFTRVYTDWAGGTWGDALYVRNKIVEWPVADVPKHFMPHHKLCYPVDGFQPFEQWFYDNFSTDFDSPEQEIERIYLPIMWTAYYCNHSHGKSEREIEMLQLYLDSLDRSKKYFTILQYDDGIINDLKDLDILVIGVSEKCNKIIPLLSTPHQISFPNTNRKYLASFIGANTHYVREKILELRMEKDFYITEYNYNLYMFCKMMSMSTFALCPRGYGWQSFRVQEALQYGAIPVIIGDDAWLPPFFREFCLTISDVNVKLIPDILKSISPERIRDYRISGQIALQSQYNYLSQKRLILQYLEENGTV